VRAARALQSQLATRVSLRDGFRDPLRTVAGFDVGFEDHGATTRAAAVLLDADSLHPIASEVARIPTRMPYIPGLLSFRELPALLAALAMLPRAPDLAFVDGHGIAHPRRLGIAAHFGIASGLPCIGVAKKVLVGSARNPLHDVRGAFVPLRDGAEQVGWLLRSRTGCNPLVVSPGHRVAMASAPELVMRWTTRYRLPEPTRLADRLASRRGP
jgi:deoxyribonuclease V